MDLKKEWDFCKVGLVPEMGHLMVHLEREHIEEVEVR